MIDLSDFKKPSNALITGHSNLPRGLQPYLTDRVIKNAGLTRKWILKPIKGNNLVKAIPDVGVCHRYHCRCGRECWATPSEARTPYFTCGHCDSVSPMRFPKEYIQLWVSMMSAVYDPIDLRFDASRVQWVTKEFQDPITFIKWCRTGYNVTPTTSMLDMGCSLPPRSKLKLCIRKHKPCKQWGWGNCRLELVDPTDLNELYDYIFNTTKGLK